MSLEEFGKLYNHPGTDYNSISRYIKQNETILRNINSDSVNGVILKMYLNSDIKCFADSKYEWSYISHRKFGCFSWEDIVLQPKDLSDERMTGMSNDPFYVILLNLFLIYHEIEDIPQSFLDLGNNKYDIFYDLCSVIRKEYLSFFESVKNKTIKNNKLIRMIPIYLPSYDEEFRNERPSSSLNKDEVFEILINRFGKYVDTDEDDIDSYKSVIVTEDNIIEIIFDIIVNNKYQGDLTIMTIISNYFEYMKLSEQVTYWTIINDCSGDYFDTSDIILNSQSEAFIEYAFSHSSEFSNQDEICDIICGNDDSSDVFLKFFIKKYPDMTNTVFIYKLIVDPDECYSMFPHLSVEEMIAIIEQYITE